MNASPLRTRYPLCRQFRITHKQIATRKQFLNFSDADESNLCELRNQIENEADELIFEFYKHLGRFPELGKLIRDRAVHAGLRKTLRQYLLGLGEHSGQPDYFENRLRVGVTHERVGLEQRWYLGAYAILFEKLARRLGKKYANQPELLTNLLITLNKVFTLDATLAIETYHQANLQRLERLLAELTQAKHRLQALARTDELTSIHNRRSLLELLERERKRSQRFHRPFSLLFLDIDHFKRVNDRHGHGFGDYVLKRIAQAVSAVLRPEDAFGRFGGEEFLVGLIETNEAGARRVAERIRETIEHSSYDSGGTRARLTVSIGVCEMKPSCEKLESLIDRADRALYRAKQSGRNKVCVDE